MRMGLIVNAPRAKGRITYRCSAVNSSTTRCNSSRRSDERRGAVTVLSIALRLLGSTDLQPHRHFDVRDMDGQDAKLLQNAVLQLDRTTVMEGEVGTVECPTKVGVRQAARLFPAHAAVLARALHTNLHGTDPHQ